MNSLAISHDYPLQKFYYIIHNVLIDVEDTGSYDFCYKNLHVFAKLQKYLNFYITPRIYEELKRYSNYWRFVNY